MSEPGQEPLPSSAPESSPLLARGASIGRYIVLETLGQGGMGDVYGAYDPKLNRKVAVKVLRALSDADGDRSEGRNRRLREAQATAKLSHPNVVVIFDVGTFRDTVFLAMEFIDGSTIRQWRQAGPHGWKDILRVFLAAGRGLAAAHAAGLVHNDFKPDNVMVGRDGKVRVMDFGLARPGAPPTTDAAIANDAAAATAAASGGAAPIGATVAVVPAATDPDATRPSPTPGTPAYMAPEQLAARPTDASADQYSYCLALYETLYGERPFDDRERAPEWLVSGAAALARVREPPPGSAVPLWIRKILLRGLLPTPADRYPSMEQLLGALEQDRGAARRRWALRAGTALLVLAAGGLALSVNHRLGARGLACQGGAAKLAGIWEAGGVASPRKAAVRAAFAATGKSSAQRTFDSVGVALDRYVASWMAIYGDACEATTVRHQQAAEVLDLRMSCLNGRLEEVRALTDLFLRADGPLLEKATSAARALAPLDRCSDLAILRAVVQPPDDPAVRSRVQQVRRRLAQAKALQDAGRVNGALSRAQSLVAEARELGYLPLKAEVLTRLGWLSLGRPVQAEAILAEAAFSASASGDHELFAEAAIAQVLNVGFLEGDPDRARPWIGMADATLNRIGGHEILRSWLVNNQGAVVYAQGRYEEAIALFRQSTTLKEKVLGPNSPDLAGGLANMGDPLVKLGRFEEALAVNQRALRILEATGEGQEGLPTVLSSRGEYLNALGRFAEAEAVALRATQLWERNLDAENAYLAYPLTVLGRSYLGQDRARDAVAPLARAYDLRSRLDPDPSRLGETAFALAQALWRRSQRDRPRALALAAEAARAYARTPETQTLADVRLWLKHHAPA